MLKEIVRLEKVKREKEKFKVVFSDDTFVFLIDEVLAGNKIRTGKSFEENEIEEFAFISEKKELFRKMAKILERRLKTENELKVYFKQKGYLDKAVDCAIEKLKEYKLISDENYVKAYYNTHSGKKGNRLIKFELEMKGISKEELAGKTDEDQSGALIALSEKYMKNKEKTKENFEKLFRYLSARGFEYADIKKTMREMKAETEEDSF